MPPPVVFPIVWSTIAVLRSVSTTMVWEASGRDLLIAPISWFVLHLCVGDTWNTINNVEQRKGTAAVVVLLVWATAANAIFQYYQVSPTAGYVLAPLAVWLSVASVLVWSIWAINGKENLFPMKEASEEE